MCSVDLVSNFESGILESVSSTHKDFQTTYEGEIRCLFKYDLFGEKFIIATLARSTVRDSTFLALFDNFSILLTSRYILFCRCSCDMAS